MSKQLLICAMIFCVADTKAWSAKDCADFFSADYFFCEYMTKHGKIYTVDTWRQKEVNVKESLTYVRSHNAQNILDYELQLTSMSDLLHSDFVKNRLTPVKKEKVNGRKLGQSREIDKIQAYLKSHYTPKSFDWRTNSHMTPVSTQGKCGSCFAIVAAEMMDWWGDKLRTVPSNATSSVQQLMDCSSDEFPNDAERCLGSVMEYPLRYAKENRVWHDRDYMYEAHDDICKHKRPPYKTLHPENMHHTGQYDEPDLNLYLPAYIYHFGPIGVSFDASDQHFQHLGKGIYTPHRCSNTNVNHAVLVVGYTSQYYIVKNSWGPHYGENGYFKVKRGRNLCGMLEVVSVVTSAKMR
jgi:C1A family cysteine protease